MRPHADNFPSTLTRIQSGGSSLERYLSAYAYPMMTPQRWPRREDKGKRIKRRRTVRSGVRIVEKDRPKNLRLVSVWGVGVGRIC